MERIYIYKIKEKKQEKIKYYIIYSFKPSDD
jgi:hypothetical protein